MSERRHSIGGVVRRSAVWWCLAVFVLFAACDRAPAPTMSSLITTSSPRTTASPDEDGSVLAVAPGSFLRACRQTAAEVAYPVPCPSEILAGATPPRQVTTCRIGLIGAGGLGGCSRAWRGWVVGSMQTDQHHLVLQASPEPVRSLSKMINGPGWYRGARVVPLGIVHVDGWTMREVFADPATNEGSIFAGHVVLVWTTGGHTYALGFHLSSSRRETEILNEAVAGSVSLVPP
jgi:hypothetical protein